MKLLPKKLGRGRMHAYISTDNLRIVQMHAEEQKEAGSPTSVAQVDGVIRRVTSAPHPRGSSAPIMNPDIAQTRSQSELASIGRCYIIKQYNTLIRLVTLLTCAWYNQYGKLGMYLHRMRPRRRCCMSNNQSKSRSRNLN